MIKSAGTSEVAIAIVFLVMNLMRIAQFLYASGCSWLGEALLVLFRHVAQWIHGVDRGTFRPLGRQVLAAG